MTKEKLQNLLFEAACISSPKKVRIILDSFFSQNLVIPKGENRHPYADVLHEYIEGTKIECNENNSGWYTLCHFPFTSKYRIKPKEPVYEYQYAIVTSVSGNARLEWMTQNEALSKYGSNSYRIEETKRERK